MNITQVKQIKDQDGAVVAVSCIVDGESLSFPADAGNRHYQTYLKWLEEGNEPLPADEPTA